MIDRPWRGAGGIGEVYVWSNGYNGRLGYCAWKPLPGDLCIRTDHSGDCFHTYVALRMRGDGKYVKVGAFGAYVFSEAACKPDDRTIYLALAGEAVTLDITQLVLRAQVSQLEAQADSLKRDLQCHAEQAVECQKLLAETLEASSGLQKQLKRGDECQS